MVPAVRTPTSTAARYRRPAAAAAVVVALATSLVAGAGTDPTGGDQAACCVEMAPTAPRAPQEAPPSAARHVRHVLAAGVAPEKGLQVETILAARAVSGMFPEILTIGGVRPDSMRWHPDGLAIDVMIPNYRSPQGKALGDRIVAFALENADRFGLNHVLWRQTSYGPGRAPRHMSSRGGDTANHFDHVHIATNGGGYPKGNETYLS
ncbi:hypothetical protein ACWDTP_11200 [Mycobacterium sp. NPDC003449]